MFIDRTIERDYPGLTGEKKARCRKTAKKIFWIITILSAGGVIAEDTIEGHLTLTRVAGACLIGVMFGAMLSYTLLNLYYLVTEDIIKRTRSIKLPAFKRKKDNS